MKDFIFTDRPKCLHGLCEEDCPSCNSNTTTTPKPLPEDVAKLVGEFKILEHNLHYCGLAGQSSEHLKRLVCKGYDTITTLPTLTTERDELKFGLENEEGRTQHLKAERDQLTHRCKGMEEALLTCQVLDGVRVFDVRKVTKALQPTPPTTEQEKKG